MYWCQSVYIHYIPYPSQTVSKNAITQAQRRRSPIPNPKPKYSHHRAANPIHCPLDPTLDLIPVRPSLRKLIHLLGAEDAMEAIPVRDDGRELLGVRRIDQVDLRELAERLEELQQVVVLERLDVGEVEVHVAV